MIYHRILNIVRYAYSRTLLPANSQSIPPLTLPPLGEHKSVLSGCESVPVS